MAKKHSRRRLRHGVPSRSQRTQYAQTLFVSSALAAAGAVDAATPDAQSLDEIVVVARHYRAEEQTSATGLQIKLIDTPQAISVLTPEMLRVAGASSIYEATDFVPSLRRSGTGFGLDRFVLRGNLLTSHRINGTDFAVWHSLEGFAIDRFEIVRGPATALYGVTGSFGGEINQLLKSPKKEFAGEVGFKGGDFDLKEYQADLTGPIPGTGDRLSGRVVGLYRDSGSWVNKDIVRIHDNKRMVMGSLKYDFSENTSARIWVYYDHAKMDPHDGGFLQSLPDGQLTFPNVPADDWYFNDPRYTHNTISNSFFIADVQHKFANDWNFKAQASLSKSKNNMSEYYVFGPAGAYSLADNEAYLYSYDQIQENEDATFDMSLGGKFNVLGREQQFFTAFEGQGSVDPSKNTLFNSIYIGNINMYQGGRGVLADGTPTPLIDKSTLTVRNYSEGRFRDYRGSIQFLIDPIDRVKILAGVLVQHTIVKNVRPIAGSVVIANPVESKTTFTETVKRFGITYDLVGKHGVMDATKAYFSYSEGFNPNIGVVDRQGNALTAPQLMKQYEVGIKSEFLSGAIGSSIALYNSRILNIPVQTNFLGGFGGAGSALEGKRRIKGLEFELIGEFTRGWNVALNYAYTDSVISDPNYTFTIPVKTVPKHAGALYTSYEFTAGSLRGLRLGGDVAISSDYSLNPSLGNTEKFGRYMGFGGTRIDLNLSYRFQQDRLRGLELYANALNISDRDIFVAKEDHPGFGITRDDPRQITFGVRYDFR